MEMQAEENKAAADMLNMQVRGQRGCLWLPVRVFILQTTRVELAVCM